MSTADEFLAKIEGYLKAANVGPTVLGRMAVNDPNFVRDLRAGRVPSLNTVDKVNEYIAANPPNTTSEAAE